MSRPRKFPSRYAREMFEYAEANGMEFVRFCSSTHMLLRHTVTGKTVLVAGTTANRRSYRNSRADIRRAGEAEAA